MGDLWSDVLGEANSHGVFFDKVFNDFIVRSFLRFGYEVSFKVLDKGAIEHFNN